MKPDISNKVNIFFFEVIKGKLILGDFLILLYIDEKKGLIFLGNFSNKGLS